MSGRALRSDSVHTRCSFRSDYDIKQEPVTELHSSGKHPPCHETKSACLQPLNLLCIFPLTWSGGVYPRAWAQMRIICRVVATPQMIRGGRGPDLPRVRTHNICLRASAPHLSGAGGAPCQHVCAHLVIFINIYIG